MAYTMTHILIAEQVQKRLSEIEDGATYLLGTIAPDAVHANPGYHPGLKETSHLLPPDVRWGRVEKEEQVEAWIDRIDRFYEENKTKYDRDFLLGYVVHLLVDVYSVLYFYIPYVKEFREDYENGGMQFRQEAFGTNYEQYLTYSKEKDLQQVLHAGRAFALEGFIEKEDIENRIDRLFQEEFRPQQVDTSGYIIYTLDKWEELIEGATDYITERLLTRYLK